MRWVLFALLAIPLVDIALLIYVAGIVGPVATVAIVVLTGLVGLLLVRAEGRHTLGRIREKLARGQPPTDELLDGGLLIAAGAFLLTPGLVTDAVGFLLVLPPSRYAIREATKRWGLIPELDVRTGGFVTGNVYTGGFPGDAGDAAGGSDPRDPGPEDGDAYDLGEDAYDIDLEDEDGNGNA